MKITVTITHDDGTIAAVKQWEKKGQGNPERAKGAASAGLSEALLKLVWRPMTDEEECNETMRRC